MGVPKTYNANGRIKMLIAEIGNNHFGNLDTAKELIKSAISSGADVVKMQAFDARDMTKGSMDYSFYKQCEFTIEEHLELQDYARLLKSELFWSIFSDSYLPLIEKTSLHKIAGGQLPHWWEWVQEREKSNWIVSIKEDEELEPLKQAMVMHVSGYFTLDPKLQRIYLLSLFYGKQAGYSDHTPGIYNCEVAIKQYGARLIEKHFTLKKDLEWNGKIFRDTQHAATPGEFEALANILRTA